MITQQLPIGPLLADPCHREILEPYFVKLGVYTNTDPSPYLPLSIAIDLTRYSQRTVDGLFLRTQATQA